MRSLHKKLFRSIREGWGQSLAVVMVVGSGIANYICLNSAYLDLSQTRDNYYRQERLADFELILERAPAASNFRLEDLSGVRQVRGRIIGEANLDIEGIDEPRTGRIVSMPPTHTPVINDIIMRSGKYFDEGAEDQVILSEKFATTNHIALGDRIDVTVKSKRYALRVVGTAISPEFVYLIRNVQELIPAPERFGVLWVPNAFAETCMDMKGSCNSFLGTLDDPDTAPVVLDAAEKLMKPFGVHAKVTRWR
jgi:putative ABC transport system permease protein